MKKVIFITTEKELAEVYQDGSFIPYFTYGADLKGTGELGKWRGKTVFWHGSFDDYLLTLSKVKEKAFKNLEKLSSENPKNKVLFFDLDKWYWRFIFVYLAVYGLIYFVVNLISLFR